jgi:hypothetical protein
MVSARFKKIIYSLSFLLVAFILVQVGRSAHAFELSNRTLEIKTSIGGATTQHILSFNFEDPETIGSLDLQYCTSPVEAIACTPPPGLNAASAVLSAQSGETGFTILSQNANEIVLSRAPSTTGLQLNSYTFDNVVNPSNKGPFFLRINTYASTDATGPKIDFGGTAGSITQSISISAEVPPILQFCVGITIQGFCTIVDGTFLDLGVLTSTRAAVGTSRFQAYTNAEFGYSVRVTGTTITSGNNVINALASPTPSSPGTRQFGINLRANTQPAVGADPISGNGVIAANYVIPNRYTYNDGDVLVTNPGIGDFETYTVTYLVNIIDNQTPGIYNTILTYFCTANF